MKKILTLFLFTILALTACTETTGKVTDRLLTIIINLLEKVNIGKLNIFIKEQKKHGKMIKG
ncbi:hypothetical protein [Gottfriedia acidiceleris]|uniref:hypothetical protein n=1 Tax=Gottfriedia acidiceleris TaxID=371036 RepID=UPI002FFE68B8